MNIEAEGKELILKDERGNIAIIPKKYRQEVLDMIKEGCKSCLKTFIAGLPLKKEYAEDGNLIEVE